jgi:ABC-type multidrug transport system fused ATPase/permease subunit
MQADLKELEISEVELQALTGVVPSLSGLEKSRSPEIEAQKSLRLRGVIIASVFLAALLGSLCYFVPDFRLSAAVFTFCLLLGASSLTMELAEVAILGFAFALAAAVYAVYTLTATSLQIILGSLAIAILMALAVILLMRMIPNGFTRQRQPKPPKLSTSLKRLYGEVEKYNKVIRDIHVFDQLEAAGNPIRLSDRESVLSALKITHSDLIRALKTEKILRDNPDFNPEQFAIDLTAFHAIQVNEKASEYGQFFDTTIQIAIAVQKTMQDLQSHS